MICHTVTVLTRMETNGPTLVLMSDMEGPFVMRQVLRFKTINHRSNRIICLEKTLTCLSLLRTGGSSNDCQLLVERFSSISYNNYVWIAPYIYFDYL